MPSSEQKKYFERLKLYERKFDKDEKRDYDSYLIRHKDDEELDFLSMKRLRELYEKYYVNRPKKNYDDIFKKPDNIE